MPSIPAEEMRELLLQLSCQNVNGSSVPGEDKIVQRFQAERIRPGRHQEHYEGKGTSLKHFCHVTTEPMSEVPNLEGSPFFFMW